MLCANAFFLTAYIVMHVIQAVFGGLSVVDCQIPAIITLASAVLGLVFICYKLYLTLCTQVGTSQAMTPLNMTILAFFVITQSVILGVLDNRDNGVCKNEDKMYDVAISLLVFYCISLSLKICATAVLNGRNEATPPRGADGSNGSNGSKVIQPPPYSEA